MNSARLRQKTVVEAVIAAVVLLVLALGPLIFTDPFLSLILTKAMWLGIAAASLIFLTSYGGMISLAQTALYGIGGYVMAEAVAANGGLEAAVDPWVGVILGIAVATAIGLVFGAVSARSEGIYFLMITLAFSVIVFYFFGQVTVLGGFGGLNNVATPGIVSHPPTDPNNLFYIGLIVSLGVYGFIRYLVRTPFGIALQGIRDESTRMRALGYNVALHRTIAFGVGALIAAVGGILSVWWQTRIDPNSINLAATIDLLVVAVIGGLYRLPGAWLGAFVFAVIDFYSREIGFVGLRFNTVIGSVFLLIVLVSPGGLMGMWDSAWSLAARRRRGTASIEEPSAPAASPGG